MAKFSPSYKGSSEFNGGEKYRNNIDSPSATDFNNVVENLLVLNEDSDFLHDNVVIRLNGAEANIRSFDRKLDGISETIEQDFSETKKKVENLYARTFPEIDVIDSSVAYQRIVPDGALPYAEVAKVGGMSYKSANLAKPNEGTRNNNGFISSTDENGRLIVTGSASQSTNTTLDLGLVRYDGTIGDIPLAAGVEYSYSIVKDGKPLSNYSIGVRFRIDYTDAQGGTSWSWAGQDKSRPRSVKRIYIQEVFEAGSTDICGTYEVMINEGSTALPYEPYFEGLRHAKVTEIKSIGANLFDFEKHRTNGYKSTFNVVAGATLYRNTQVGSMSDWTVYDSTGNSIGTFASLGFTESSPFVLPSNAAYIGTIDTKTGYLELLYIGYDSDTTFRPYTELSLSIPSAVQDLPDYGKTDTYIEWRDDGRYFVTPDGKTNISHLLPDDNFIRVEGGGTITAVNEYGLAAPITINYQVD